MHSPCILDARTSHAAMPTFFRGTHLHPVTDDRDSVLDDKPIESPSMPWEMTRCKPGERLLERGGEAPWRPCTTHCGRG